MLVRLSRTFYSLTSISSWKSRVLTISAPGASRRDQERENYFRNNGYNPILVSAEQVSDDPDSLASFILEVATTQQQKEKAPPLWGDRVADFVLVQFNDRVGFWTEGEDASKWWSLYSQSLREDWLRSGEGEETHANIRWNKYVNSDKTVRAKLDYATLGPEEARRFAQCLIGRRIVEAAAEGNSAMVRIDTS